MSETTPITAAGSGEVAELAERILTDVRRADLPSDGRLPTERQLALDYGVSRASVRNALARLEAGGWLSRHVGRGTFLRLPDASPALPDPLLPSADGLPPRPGGALPRSDGPPRPRAEVPGYTDVSPADVMAVRGLLEPNAMALVVARATARDFAEMDRCLAGGDAAESYDEFERWDLALHRCLVEASHNPLLIQLYDAVEAARHGQMWGQLKRRNDNVERRQRYRCEHHAVVDAARVRDGNAAVAAMRAHLSSVSTNLFGPVM